MSLKKKVTQGDLRKAMTEAKKKIGTVKKIESPLAKYNEGGQLMCILCKTVIRSETVWPVHLSSKNHKENLILAKKTISETAKAKESSVSIAKRPSSPKDTSGPNKRVKGILKSSGNAKAPSNLPVDFFDNAPETRTHTTTSQTSEKSEIPRAEKPREGGNKIAHEAAEDANTASLPEGFFDDPRMDAKVRNVDYKDPIEEEWDKFQKEIKEETAQSAQIIADDQEEATTERQIDEIEEQIRHWSRVMDLVRRKEEVQKDTDKQKESVSDEESSDEDEEYDEFLDWRAKNSYH